MSKKKFGLVGNGFVADRHVKAIEHVGGELVWVCDIDDRTESKIVDTGADFFENFQEALDSRDDLDYVSICTPNHLHAPMAYNILLAFDQSVKIILEKPVCTTPDNFRELQRWEAAGAEVYVTQQLRYSEYLKGKKQEFDDDPSFKEVLMQILVHRGPWYFQDSWKGDVEKSGGCALNIGVHYFDLLTWFFGKPVSIKASEDDKSAFGVLGFENAKAYWELDLEQPKNDQKRLVSINGQELNLSLGFEQLHNKVYEDIISGGGLKPSDISTTMDLMWKMRGK
jgi:UDP-N-acetyl-2-amino-2-deoxyglucuronate dehydrogenase